VRGTAEADFDRELWGRTARVLLEAPLWQPRDAYDAGHFLYVPLCAAFELNEPAWQRDFQEHFVRFLAASSQLPAEEHLFLGYGFLSVRYCTYAAASAQRAAIPPGLPQYWLSRLVELWLRDPAWQWRRDPFAGFRERLDWKLSRQAPLFSFEQAILDDDLWVFGMAAELSQLDRLGYSFGLTAKQRATLVEILDYAARVFRECVVGTPDGRWLFQPGVWRDAAAQAQAGFHETFSGMPERLREDVAWDSSHSYRFPVVLASLEAAAERVGQPAQAATYRALRNGLARQFQERVLVRPTADFPVWRMANYMDGWNGVYQWEPSLRVGYGPFQLSGSLAVGLWSALRTEPMREVFANLARNFPLPERVLDTYHGPVTQRERHPLLSGRGSWKAGHYELIARLAARLPVAESLPQAVAEARRAYPPPHPVTISGLGSFDPNGHPIVEWEWRENGQIQYHSDWREIEVDGERTLELRVRNSQGWWSLPVPLRIAPWPPAVQLRMPNRLPTSTRPRFDWAEVYGRISYRVQLEGPTMLSADIQTPYWQPPAPLEPGVPYALTVTTVDGTRTSEPVRCDFSVSLAKPTILSPPGPISGAEPSFVWTKVDGAIHYLVHLVNRSSNVVLYSRFVAASRFPGALCELAAPIPLPHHQLLSLQIAPGCERFPKGPGSLESLFFLTDTALSLRQGTEGWHLEIAGPPGATYDLSRSSAPFGPWTSWQSATLPPQGRATFPILSTDPAHYFRSELRRLAEPAASGFDGGP